MIELIVVLAIIMVVSLSAVTGYSNMRRSRSVRQGAETIQAAFVSARAYAITTNGSYRVVFQLRDPATDDPATSFWVDEIYRDSNHGSSPSAADVTRDVKTPKITTPERLPEGVDLADVTITQKHSAVSNTVSAGSSSYAVVRFFPDGSSDGSVVRLTREGTLSADNNPRAYSVFLASPTAKPKIVSAELR